MRAEVVAVERAVDLDALPRVGDLERQPRSTLESAVLLVKEGAADYLAKPWDDQKLVVKFVSVGTKTLRARYAKLTAR